MVSYERLWKTMEKKGISQYRLINHYKISAGQIGRMKKNMHVSTHTLEVFCNILQCPVEDIVEVILDPQEPDGKEPSSAGGGRLEGPQPGPGMPKKRRASPEIRRLESQDPDPESREPGRPQQSPEKSQPERQKTVLAEKRLGRLRLVPERETSR